MYSDCALKAERAEAVYSKYSEACAAALTDFKEAESEYRRTTEHLIPGYAGGKAPIVD